MSDSFNVTVADVRTHAQSVQKIASVVSGARSAAVPAVGEGSYGLVGEFFAAAISAAAGTVLEKIGSAAQSVDDVRTGLLDAAADYERIDVAHAKAFAGYEGEGSEL